MSFWKKFAKIASIAAPIIAAPFTGGASLMLLGAGAGAASAKLSGAGWKGTLAGAGLGAIPGAGKLGAAGKFGSGVAKVAGATQGASPSASVLEKALSTYGKAQPYIKGASQVASVLGEQDEPQYPAYFNPGPMQSRAWDRTQFSNNWMQPMSNRYSNWRNY